MIKLYNYQKRIAHAEKRLAKSNISQRNKELLKKFLEEYGTDHNLSLGRKHKYISNFKTAIEHLNVDLDRATVNDFRAFIERIKALNRSERTKEDYIILFKTFYKWYGKSQKTSPELQKTLDYVKDYSFKVDRNKLTEAKILSPEEVKKLVSSCKSLRDKALIMTLWDTGARIGEILTLKNEDIQPFEYGNKIVITQSKTDKRTLPVIECSPYLTEYINSKGEKFKDKSHFFWIDQFGNMLSYSALRTQLKRIMADTGIKKRMYAHLLRHSRATYLANKGWTEAQMCKWFGWRLGSEMPATYIKKSGIDLEDPMLKMQGIKKEEQKDNGDNLKPLTCWFCKTINEATNTYCKKCSKPLRPEDIQKIEAEREERIKEATNITEAMINEKVKEAFKKYINKITAIK